MKETSPIQHGLSQAAIVLNQTLLLIPVCNAEETDTRIWLHVKQTDFQNILVISPDTDVYNKNIIVQVNPMNCRELK